MAKEKSTLKFTKSRLISYKEQTFLFKMLLLKSIFICSEYLISQKSFMEEMSKECVLKNLNLGHWCQVLGLVLVLHLKSWILGPGPRVWILIIRCDNYCKAGADDITKSINILNAINILKFERGSKFFCKMQNWYSWA